MNRNNGPSSLQALTAQEELNLVQRVFLNGGPHAPRVVLFSGVGHRNGCSRVCARSSEVLAAEGHGAVCVVDANVRSPSLHAYFGVGNERGLADALDQQGPIQGFARYISKAGVWLLPSGSSSQDYQAAARRERLRSRVLELRTAFDFVLIDAAPADLYLDSGVLAPMTDGVILVLEAHATRREIARHTKERLEAVGVPVLGAVLNKRTFPVPEALYRRC